MPDARYRKPDTGYRMQDARFQMPNTGYGIAEGLSVLSFSTIAQFAYLRILLPFAYCLLPIASWTHPPQPSLSKFL